MNTTKMTGNRRMLFDGAMGTWYAQKYREPLGACEMANLSAPERIREIHEEYIRAGASALRTNTFGAYPGRIGHMDQRAVVEAGWRIAADAAASAGKDGRDVRVFADLGPAPASSLEDPGSIYCQMAEIFIDCGAENFIFETLGNDFGILGAVSFIKQKVKDACVIVSFGVQPDGFTREGVYYRHLIRRMEESGIVDATGLNCVSGAGHMVELIRDLGECSLPVCALPNVGYPVVVGNRTSYGGDPEYFASQIRALKELGVAITGGCCGTTPLHIRYLYRDRENLPRHEKITVPVMKTKTAGAGSFLSHKRTEKSTSLPKSRIWEGLEAKEKIIAVELDSPRDCDISGFMRRAKELKNAGADALTIADSPAARPRMDSSLLACKVRRELNMDVIPHMTCRDRNTNATKALLLGISAEGIRNVLVVTGDPIPTSERSEVHSVYQFNSVRMASYIQGLNKEVFPEPIHIFGALNLNAVNFEAELKKCEKKREAGMYGFLTQPILSKQAFENLKLARDKTDLKILGGVIPVVSERNALFMESEVSGIHVSNEIIQMYHGKTRQECEELAYKISCEVARQIEPFIDGFYLITPFNRTELMCRIIHSIRSM